MEDGVPGVFTVLRGSRLIPIDVSVPKKQSTSELAKDNQPPKEWKSKEGLQFGISEAKLVTDWRIGRIRALITCKYTAARINNPNMYQKLSYVAFQDSVGLEELRITLDSSSFVFTEQDSTLNVNATQECSIEDYSRFQNWSLLFGR